MLGSSTVSRHCSSRSMPAWRNSGSVTRRRLRIRLLVLNQAPSNVLHDDAGG
jgi:hypothetical protein